MKDFSKEISTKFLEKVAYIYSNYKSHKIVGIFAYGSMNYGLYVDGSDVDIRVLILPTLDDLALGYNDISTTWDCNDGSHIEFLDIRKFFKAVRKQNINFVEILFTEWYYIDNKYKAIWQLITDNAEKIARYSPILTYYAARGMADKYKKLGGAKGKANLARLYEFLCKYLDNEDYGICLQVSEEAYKVRCGNMDIDPALLDKRILELEPKFKAIQDDVLLQHKINDTLLYVTKCLLLESFRSEYKL